MTRRTRRALPHPATHPKTGRASLLHRVFGSVRLNVSQVGIDGRMYNPHEWFVAPLPVINQAIKMILTGDIVNVVYDPAQEQLVPRED